MLRLDILLGEEALHRYDDHGDPAYTTFHRVLMALNRLDWANSDEIADALELGDDEASRRRVWAAIAYLVRVGQVEKRRSARAEYRLNVAAFTAAPTEPAKRCRRCTSDALPGRTLCRYHGDYQRSYKAAWKARRAA